MAATAAVAAAAAVAAMISCSFLLVRREGFFPGVVSIHTYDFAVIILTTTYEKAGVEPLKSEEEESFAEVKIASAPRDC